MLSQTWECFFEIIRFDSFYYILINLLAVRWTKHFTVYIHKAWLATRRPIFPQFLSVPLTTYGLAKRFWNILSSNKEPKDRLKSLYIYLCSLWEPMFFLQDVSNHYFGHISEHRNRNRIENVVKAVNCLPSIFPLIPLAYSTLRL